MIRKKIKPALKDDVLGQHCQNLKIVTEEIDPSLGNVKYYFYKELNCNYVDLDWDVERVIENLKTISILVYQELNTDIKGNPN